MILAIHRLPRVARTALLLLAVFATLGLSLATVTHVDESPSGCSICFATHTVALDAPAIHLLDGPAICRFEFSSPAAPTYRPYTPGLTSSRAPPALPA